MTGRIPDPGSPFEDAGLPDLDGGLPGKRITGDPQDDLPVPGDEPMALDDFGTTAAEQQEGEPLDLRLAREEPDVIADDEDTAAGRIVEVDEGASPDVEPDAIGVDVGTDGGGMTAEEQAMHIEPG